MLQRLESNLGITGSALQWLRSYFADRKQFVCINGSKSEFHHLPYGVPQGSLIGPFSFPKYTAKIAEKFNINFHLFADDTQLYCTFDKGKATEAASLLEECIEEIRQWMRRNMLKLNDSKTEILCIGSKHMMSNAGVSSLAVGESNVQVTTSARNIGVIMDDRLSMADHINATCKSAYLNLRNIACARRYLTEDTTSTLVHSLVTSKLDCLNALFYGLPDTLIKKLQRIQNHAANVIKRRKKHDHVTPLLVELHWLPVKRRIRYKVLLLTFRYLNGKAPKYLCDLLQTYQPIRSLRSESRNLLIEKSSKSKTYGDRAFSVAAPRLWNSMPMDLRDISSIETFKKKLKTYLFKEAYDL